MKTKKIAVFCLLLVNLTLMICLAALLAPQPNDIASVSEPMLYAVTDVPLSDLMAVKVANAKSSFAIMQNGPQIEMLSTTAGQYDVAQLRAFLYAASKITSSRTITDASTFAQYGLDAPRAQVTLYLTDGSQISLQVLAENPMDESTYLYSEQDNAIYLVSRSISELFLRTEQDFLSHMLFPLASIEDFSAISELQVQLHGRGRDYTVGVTDQGCFLTSPITHRVSSSIVNVNLFMNLLQLYADEVVRTGVSLSDYGLDTPDLSLSLTLDGQQYNVCFRLEEDGSALMAQPDGDTVYRLGSDPVLLLMQDYTHLLGNSVLAYGLGDIAELTIKSGGQRITLNVSNDDDGLCVLLGSRRLDKAQTSALNQALNQVTPTAEITGSPTDEKMLELSILLRSGSRDEIAFYPAGQDLAAVQINGVCNYATTGDAIRCLTDFLASCLP